ncbi:D-sedoheptulose-7-phosphate isomerase [Salinispora vitiensis]|uniref:D-sedoheptulose-7-phosphate isomerase n=1 Tax=Salinispora vitiensis TaxID=999544 RepID=UPI00036F3FA8|nr:SIS domain-containing protein [Salinispora vitiensis]
MTPPRSLLEEHLTGLAAALPSYRRAAQRLPAWGAELARTLAGGGRLLVAGNGGSAAEAQHLTAELVGKLRADRQPFSAIALHAETSAFTAIGNDYGYDQVFARQVHAHGRPGDILLLLSTSGRSQNLLQAARAGHQVGLRCWALTGPAPNPLAGLCHETLAVPAPDGQIVQELHLVTSHLLCEYAEQALPVVLAATAGTPTGPPVAEVPVAGPPVVGVPLTGLEAEVPADLPTTGPVRTGVEVVPEDGQQVEGMRR